MLVRKNQLRRCQTSKRNGEGCGFEETKEEKAKGPIQRDACPRRHTNDGRTMMKKVVEQAKIKNLEVSAKGKPGISFPILEDSLLLHVASKFSISLGKNSAVTNKNISTMTNAEQVNNDKFERDNPEFALPINLDMVINPEEFPPLNEVEAPSRTPLLTEENLQRGVLSWSQIVNNQDYANSKRVIK